LYLAFAALIALFVPTVSALANNDPVSSCNRFEVSHRAALGTRRALDPWRDAWYLDEEFQSSQPLPLELSPRTHDDWPLPAAPACDR